MSVNAGINGDDYKMEGLSAKQWVWILGRVGREGVMSKMDYEAAYKHIQVGRPLEYFDHLFNRVYSGQGVRLAFTSV